MPSLNDSIDGFFRSWDTYERSLITDQGIVFDFDFSHNRTDLPLQIFNDRLAVLDALKVLIARSRGKEGEAFSNPDFLIQKLSGAEAYLRQLLGERLPFASFVQSCMGYSPSIVDEDELQTLKIEAMSHLSAIELDWKRTDAIKLKNLLLYKDASEFQTDLEKQAKLWVRRLCDFVGLEIEPQYKVSIVEVDEYWSNWITGTYGVGIELRINTHPRVQLRKGKSQILAAHEIAGHALHILSLSKQSLDGNLESCLMNTSLYSAEMFQMEGLAQSLLWLIADPSEIEPFAALTNSLDMYHLALRNNAQIELEQGRPVEEIIDSVLNVAPFLEPLTLLSDLRDRSRNPIFRSYVSVYYPSYKLFIRAKLLNDALRSQFLNKIYTSFYTPKQIAELLESLLAVS